MLFLIIKYIEKKLKAFYTFIYTLGEKNYIFLNATTLFRTCRIIYVFGGNKYNKNKFQNIWLLKRKVSHVSKRRQKNANFSTYKGTLR